MVLAVNVDPAFPWQANKLPPIEVPIFDPPYSIGNNAAVTFTLSSPWPHIVQDFRQDATNSYPWYEKSEVYSPFSLSNLTWGNPAMGVAAFNNKWAFYADKDIGQTFENTSVIYCADNLHVLGGGNQTVGNGGTPFNGSKIGTSPAYRGINTFFIWDRSATGHWAFAQLGVALDILAFDSGANECDMIVPVPLVSGVMPSEFTTDIYAWRSPSITSKILSCINAYSNGIGKNVWALTLNAAVAGTALYVLSFDSSSNPAGASSNLNAITFDDANITALVNAGNCEIQGTNFGWLITWGRSTYNLIPGQGVQGILLGAVIDPTGNKFRNPFYAPIKMNPKTAKASTAVSVNNIGSMKIDPLGTFYLRNTGVGADPTYLGNSFGLDITMGGVVIPVSELSGQIGLPSFCPCSPVAVHVP